MNTKLSSFLPSSTRAVVPDEESICDVEAQSDLMFENVDACLEDES